MRHRARQAGRGLLAPAVLAAAAAAAVYLNTLPAQFTFDDSFAVVYNGDVTDLRKPLLSLFKNDFWGQDIRSPMSHKSYRPLTTLSFRAQHWLSWTLRGGEAAEQSQEEWEEQQRAEEEGGGRSGERRTARPFVFHLSNVAAHALVTALVYRLARQLAAARQLPAGRAAGAATPLLAGGGAAVGQAAAVQADLEPFLAALLFALHPVHTEAVAGVVGHAELLCAALSIPALLAYVAAADGRAGGGGRHWRAVGAAVALGWAAALAKEIGITIMGAMVCYDLLLAPLTAEPLAPPEAAAGHEAHADSAARHQRHQRQAHARASTRRTPPPGGGGGRAGGRAGAPAAAVAAAATELLEAAAGGKRGRGGSEPLQESPAAAAAERRRCRALKLQRMAVAVAAVLLYVRARSWLAGDQLVRIYRKVENPIPFAPSRLTRVLTTGYLHARYAALLLAPLQLSADWSYGCVEYVSSLRDPRNLATLALYGALLALAAAAAPWRAAAEALGLREAAVGGAGERAARWRAAVAAGLLVGPFFPASNVLFYVGTFIGERLLYFPSVGYCLLLAEPLAAALRPLSGGGGGGGGGGDGAPTRARRRAAAAAAAAALALLLGGFAAKTVLRNLDWRDEERLFIAAQKVCWRSGKVQLNSGIIERRRQRWEAAEAHFLLAQEADPQGFCEPQYHIALTYVSRNLTRAIEHLERGLACKYTAADSVKALNRIYQQLLEGSPGRAPVLMDRWASLLARPELQRFTEAATYWEQGASKAPSPLQAAMLLNRAAAALQEAAPVEAGRTPDHPVRVPASRRQLDELARCLLARRPVLLALLAAGSDPAYPSVKRAAYRYLRDHGERCRQPMPVPPDIDPADRLARSTTFHTGLMHTLQEGDVNDPWLQQEWGLMLVAAGRTQEALAHLEVAGHIFAAQLLPPSEAQAQGLKHGAVLAADGERPITQEEAAAAAAAAYRQARAAVAALQDSRVVPAARRRVICHLLDQECGAERRAAELAARRGGGAAATAAARLHGCLGQAQALGCSAAGASQPAARDEL